MSRVLYAPLGTQLADLYLVFDCHGPLTELGCSTARALDAIYQWLNANIRLENTVDWCIPLFVTGSSEEKTAGMFRLA